MRGTERPATIQFRFAGFFVRWSRCQRPAPEAVGELIFRSFMKSPFPFRVGRFCLVSSCATFVVVCLFLFDICFVDDSSGHPYSIWERVTECAMLISSWPVVVAALIRGQDPPMALWILLWVISGLFWGSIIEFYFGRKDVGKT